MNTRQSVVSKMYYFKIICIRFFSDRYYLPRRVHAKTKLVSDRLRGWPLRRFFSSFPLTRLSSHCTRGPRIRRRLGGAYSPTRSRPRKPGDVFVHIFPGGYTPRNRKSFYDNILYSCTAICSSQPKTSGVFFSFIL